MHVLELLMYKSHNMMSFLDQMKLVSRYKSAVLYHVARRYLNVCDIIISTCNNFLLRNVIFSWQAWCRYIFTFPALNPSFSKPFGTHNFYQGNPAAISRTVAPMNLKFCRVLETPLKVLEMLKLFT